uniref:Uncharacterized protein n=1 Tax=Sciurus vulgaris TaxID=55149 RepID=A0A8D2D567_SCIVU
MGVCTAARTSHPLSPALIHSLTIRPSTYLVEDQVWLPLQETSPITCTGCCTLCCQPRGVYYFLIREEQEITWESLGSLGN